jgi:hypothetical protein
MRTLAGLTSVLLLLAAPALAQPKDAKPAPKDAPKDPAPGGKEVEMGEEDDLGPIEDETGMEEDPDAPGGGDNPEPKVVKRAPELPVEYPAELARRPITLHAGMSEAQLDYPVYFDPLRTAGQLRAAYGITRQIQVELRYGIGSYGEIGMEDAKYYAGKAVAIGGVYQVFPWLGAQLEIPILLDPFAMGVTLGAPVKFKFSKFSLFVGRDLLTFKIAKFAPFVEDTLATEALVAADEVGVAQDVGHLRIIGGIQYSLKPTMTITGEAGFLAFDFKGDQAAQLIRASLTMNKKKLDYGARLGIDDLDNATETLNLALFAALRI